MDNEEGKRSMDDEERKQAPQRVLEQVHSDFAIAMALQEQESSFATLPSIESESDDEDERDEIEDEIEDSSEDNDYEFFESFELEGEMEFMEGQDSNSAQLEDMEEDEIDPDDMSYEDLIALGEFIGQERRGLTSSEISTFLHPCNYQCLESKTGIDRCVICQVEYEEGESLVALPNCEHPYHTGCISKWLRIRKICPICSTEVSSPKISS